MKRFIITCDSSCDAGKATIEELGVPFISFNLNSNEKNYIDNMDEDKIIEFYDDIKKGTLYHTSQINVYTYEQFFKDNYKDNCPIIHISLCEGLSNSINNAREAARNLKKEGIEVTIIDATIASLGSYMLIKEGIKLQDSDTSYVDAINILEDKAKQINTFYTTDTLTYFANGGRLSKAVALLSNALRINVVLECNAVGKLRIKNKVIGKKKAYLTIANLVKENVIDPENQTLYCSHACNYVDMKELIDVVLSVVHFKNVEIHYIGTTIGAHTGPGLLSVFFFGKKKINFQ